MAKKRKPRARRRRARKKKQGPSHYMHIARVPKEYMPNRFETTLYHEFRVSIAAGLTSVINGANQTFCYSTNPYRPMNATCYATPANFVAYNQPLTPACTALGDYINTDSFRGHSQLSQLYEWCVPLHSTVSVTCDDVIGNDAVKAYISPYVASYNSNASVLTVANLANERYINNNPLCKGPKVWSTYIAGTRALTNSLNFQKFWGVRTKQLYIDEFDSFGYATPNVTVPNGNGVVWMISFGSGIAAATANACAFTIRQKLRVCYVAANETINTA